MASNILKASKQIAEMDGLFIKGINKFESEVEFGLRIPEDKRVLIIDNEKNRAEKAMFPDHSEEIIATQFDSRTLY